MRHAMMILATWVWCLASVAQTRHYTVKDGLATNDVWQIAELPDGQILAGADGVYCLFGGRHFISVACDAARSYRPTQFSNGYGQMWQGDSLLWLRDFYRIYLFDVRNKAFRYDIAERLGEDAVRDFVEGNTNETLVPDATLKERIAKGEFATCPHLTLMLTDRQGGTWAGTLGQGIYYFAPQHPIAATIPSPDGKAVMALALTPEGRPLVATEEGIYLVEADGHTCTTVLHADSLLFHNASADSRGRIWLSSKDGLYCYDHRQGGAVHYGSHNVEGFIHSSVRLAQELPDGRMLVANHLHYLGYLDTESMTFEALNPHIPELEQYRTMIDACVLPQKHEAVIVTQNGVVRLDLRADTLLPLTMLPVGVSDKCNCVMADSRGRLWIGTPGALLCDGNIVADISVGALAEDTKGSIWASTPLGLMRIDDRGHRLMYGIAEGVPEEGLTNRALVVDAQGTVWVASRRGITLLPDTLAVGTAAPMPVHIVQLVVGDKQFSSDGRPITLPHNDNYIELQFSALNYASPQHTRYRYRLEGFDTEWQTSATGEGSGTARYNALPHGRYTFEVQAAVADGAWGQPTRQAITIRPPLWLTWWAKLLYALSGVAATASAIALYLRRKQAEMERENAERVDRLLCLREEARLTFARNIHIEPHKLAVNTEEEELMKRLMQAIEQNMDNADYTADRLAADACVSRSGLYRKMQAMLGITPNDFLRGVRLKHAARLLAETQLSVADIASSVGYATPRNFSAHFKKMFGVLPSEYKGSIVPSEE